MTTIPCLFSLQARLCCGQTPNYRHRVITEWGVICGCFRDPGPDQRRATAQMEQREEILVKLTDDKLYGYSRFWLLSPLNNSLKQLRRSQDQSLCDYEISWKRGNDKHIFQLFIHFLCLGKVYMTIEMFSPHTFIALNIEPNEKFLVRHFTARVINVLVVSVLTGCEYPNISIRADTDKYIRPGARGISRDIFIRCGPHSLPGHAGPVTYAGQSVSTSWFWFPEFVFAPRKYLPSLW